MATKAEKKEALRKEIINSASVYSSKLAGKHFYMFMVRNILKYHFRRTVFYTWPELKPYFLQKISTKYLKKEIWQIHSSIFRVDTHLQTLKRSYHA